MLIVIWDMIACIIYDAIRSQSVKYFLTDNYYAFFYESDPFTRILNVHRPPLILVKRYVEAWLSLNPYHWLTHNQSRQLGLFINPDTDTEHPEEPTYTNHCCTNELDITAA